jgi:sugar lactone lactonase YvrE
MLAHLALAIAPVLTPAATPTPHTITALAPLEVWASGLGDLRGLALDAERRVWVTDHASGRVLRLDAPGVARVVASGLQGPLGIAMDGGGRLLVAEEHAGRIVSLDADGTLAVVASGLERPRWLAVTDDGTIYVSAHRVVEPTAAEPARPGVVLTLRAAEHPAVLLHGLRRPEGLAVHGGALLVATRDGVLRVSLANDDARIEQLDGALGKAVGIAVDGRGGPFVTAARLQLADHHIAGVVVRLAPAPDVDVLASGIDGPQGLAFDADGSLFVAERRAGRVVRFVAPAAPVVDALPAWTKTPAAVVSGRAEPLARVEIAGAGAVTEVFAGDAGVFGVTMALVPDARNDFQLRALAHDGAGLSSPPASVTTVHDGRAPALSLDSPPTGAVVRGEILVRASAADAGSEVAALTVAAGGQRLDVSVTPALPTTSASASARWDTTTGPDGVQTLTAHAADRAGNVTAVTRAVTVDNTPPTIDVAGPETTSEGLRFTFRGADNLTAPTDLEFAYRLDNGPWSAFSPTAGVILTGLPPGPHRIEAITRDRVGNQSVTPAGLTFTVAGGAIGVTIVEPTAGATVLAGPLVVRGTVDAGGEDVGIVVNGLPGWRVGNTFTALVDVGPDTTTIVAVAVSVDGRRGQATIPVVVSVGAGPAPLLLASPASGLAPLTVRLSVPTDIGTVRVELDADGDGHPELDQGQVEDHPVTYGRPGVYVARARVTDGAGQVATVSAVVQVFDPGGLDTLLRARWDAMRDALRRGDVAAGVGHIVVRRRADYETAFRVLAASLPAIDTILTDLRPVSVRNASALYEMRRTDDGVLRSFEVRFAVDGDGVWRVEAF